MNKPQLSAEMEKRFDDEFVFIETNNDEGGHYDYPSLNTSSPNEIKHFLATALEEQRKEHQEEIELKDRTIENMMKEIRYLRGSQPERRKPRIRIKVGEDWHIPMITQAHDTPDGLFIEAELAILNGKE